MPHQNRFRHILLNIGPIGTILLLVIVLSACNGAARTSDIAPIVVATLAETATPEPEPTAEDQPETPTLVASTSDQLEPTAPPTAEPQPEAGQPAITFTISGGFVGFCDELTIDESGNYGLHSCRQEELSGVLVQPDLEVLQNWSETLAGFTLTFEDNPGGPDNLSSTLVFKGQGEPAADETQQQAIFDWVNSLFIRLRPQPVEPPPTPEPVEVGPEGLCPEIKRPAMLVADYENPSGLILIDPESQAACAVTLSQPPFGRIATAAGKIYYPAFNPEANTITLWQLSPTGEQTPLDFTTIEAAGPFHFTLSRDGARIAWTQTRVNFEVDPPVYTNTLWVANGDGTAQIALINQVENEETRYIEPIRFAADNNTLYYALQPDGLGGLIFNFTGRYDNMYRVSTLEGQPQLIYACPEGEAMICIGDISPDGSALAVARSGQGVVEIIGSDGNLVATLTPPATDYVGIPIFGPTGNLAFVSATLTQASAEDLPRPSPGYISLASPPYTAQPQTLLSADGVATLWEWIDENRLAYGAMDEDGNIGVSVVTPAGQTTALSPNFPLAVLR